jgi:hypothetical protein
VEKICKIWGDYEECCLQDCDTVQVL